MLKYNSKQKTQVEIEMRKEFVTYIAKMHDYYRRHGGKRKMYDFVKGNLSKMLKQHRARPFIL